MNILSKNKVLIAGIGLILLTNIFVISGAMYNRSGESDAILDLTERELTMNDWNREENSGLSLQLNWNQYIHDYNNYYRLKSEQLAALGYDLIDSEDNDVIRQYVNKQLPKSAWIVLEFDGDSYRDALQNAEEKYQEDKRLHSLDQTNKILKDRLQESERKLSWIRHSASRLYAIDAGRDPVQLRQKYSDKSQYIVTPGVVRLRYDNYDKIDEKITGYISEISVSNIHVPLEQRAVFDSLPQIEYIYVGPHYPRSFQPRYQVQLAYGQRYEPWIVSVEALK